MRPEIRNHRPALLSLLVVFVLGLTRPVLAEDPANFAATLAKAAKEDRVLVVDFYTDW